MEPVPSEVGREILIQSAVGKEKFFPAFPYIGQRKFLPRMHGAYTGISHQVT